MFLGFFSPSNQHMHHLQRPDQTDLVNKKEQKLQKNPPQRVDQTDKIRPGNMRSMRYMYPIYSVPLQYNLQYTACHLKLVFVYNMPLKPVFNVQHATQTSRQCTVCHSNQSSMYSVPLQTSRQCTVCHSNQSSMYSVSLKTSLQCTACHSNQSSMYSVPLQTSLQCTACHSNQFSMYSVPLQTSLQCTACHFKPVFV